MVEPGRLVEVLPEVGRVVLVVLPAGRVVVVVRGGSAVLVEVTQNVASQPSMATMSASDICAVPNPGTTPLPLRVTPAMFFLPLSVGPTPL